MVLQVVQIDRDAEEVVAGVDRGRGRGALCRRVDRLVAAVDLADEGR